MMCYNVGQIVDAPFFVRKSVDHWLELEQDLKKWQSRDAKASPILQW